MSGAKLNIEELREAVKGWPVLPVRWSLHELLGGSGVEMYPVMGASLVLSNDGTHCRAKVVCGFGLKAEHVSLSINALPALLAAYDKVVRERDRLAQALARGDDR